MKLLLLTDGITPFVKGGMQRHSQLLAEHLALAGHEIVLFHYSESNVTINIEEAFSVKALPQIRSFHFKYRDESRLPGHYLRAQKKISAVYLEKIVSMNEEYDFVYSKGFSGLALLQSRNKLNFKSPIGVKFHGMNMFQPQANLKMEIQKFYFQGITNKILKSADFVFSYGGKISEIIRKQCDTNVLEIPAGINPDWIKTSINPSAGKLKFLFIGRYDRVKGLPELNRAIKQLETVNENWEFHFVGPIPIGKRLKPACCIYHGEVYQKEDLVNVIDNCDVVVCTSISEGMPNVILEGMARGLAVLATDVGACSLLVKQNGVLIPNYNSELIFKALLMFAKASGADINAMKAKSLEQIQGFEWPQIAVKTTKVLEIAISSYQHPG